jgi:hypothetical protein
LRLLLKFWGGKILGSKILGWQLPPLATPK